MTKHTTLPLPTHNPCEATQTVGRCYGVSRVKQFGTLPLLAETCYSLSGVLCFGEVAALCSSFNSKAQTATGTATVIGGARTRKASVTGSAPKQAHRRSLRCARQTLLDVLSQRVLRSYRT